MNKISTICIDLAKHVFQLMAFDEQGHPSWSKRLSRIKLKETLVNQPPCTIVMEACSSSHYWGRTFQAMGHQVQLVPAQHVTPFVRGNKNDKNDCLAIYEASQRPNLRFVPVKSEQQQAILMLHRLRERLIAARTACINQTRSLLLEFGIVMPKSLAEFRAHIPKLADSPLHPLIQLMLSDVDKELRRLDKQVQHIEAKFKETTEQNPVATVMRSIPGIGPLIASAFSAAIDKGQAFSNGRDLGVWLGLTPLQYASGNINRLGGITKRGDGYLRKQLIHGARTVVQHAHKKDDDLNRWITELKARRGINKTVVATAHRLARLMWILLQKNECYTPQFTQKAV